MNGFMSVWNAWYDNDIRRLVEAGPMYAIETASGALPLALLVLAVNVLARRWLSAAQMGVLWSLVLVRLLIPTPPGSPFSLNNLLEGIHYSDSAPTHGEIEVRTVYEAPPDRILGDAPLLGGAMTSPTSSTEDWFDVLVGMSALVWFAVAVGMFAATLMAHWRFCRHVRRSPVCHDARLVGLWDECCRTARVNRRLTLTVCDSVQQPAVHGFLHPELLLPESAPSLSDSELRMVMLHELAHVRRWDLAVNWALLVARTLHWWNPLYWLAASRILALREQACDAFVLRGTTGTSIRDYSELLLKFAQQVTEGKRHCVLLPASLPGFIASRFRTWEVGSRLKALRCATSPRSPWQTVTACLFIFAVALCGLTDAEPVTPAEGIPQRFPPNLDLIRMRTPVPEQTDRTPHFVVSYATDEIHTRMPQLRLDQAQFRQAVESRVADLLHSTRTDSERKATSKPPAPGEDSPGGMYQLHGGSLILRASAAIHQQVADMLQYWDATGPARICIECRMFSSPNELASSIGVGWKTLGAEKMVRDKPLVEAHDAKGTILRTSAEVEDNLPAFVVPLKDQQVRELVELAQKEPRANLMFVPKVTLFNGQQAEVASIVQRPYVAGLDLK